MKIVSMLDPKPLRAALGALALASATIIGAWIFQFAGFLPCELCLQERWPYYVGVPLAAIAALVCWRGPARLRAPLLLLLGLVFVGSALFGAYHAGVEWRFWQGPTGCTGKLAKASNMNDFMHQLQTVKVVRCDAVAIRILGLSLAGWNAVISALIAVIAFGGARRA
ncbi:MAG TPA: disulfide bond formation protein B [Beijerinckiaceae bacterium]|nr:disulfide bond formation protein B [Beijerinckiaceae bacterium]HVB90125.1 disulfide bond formation protein B [Beijerinckiaceae bacterium]